MTKRSRFWALTTSVTSASGDLAWTWQWTMRAPWRAPMRRASSSRTLPASSPSLELSRGGRTKARSSTFSWRWTGTVLQRLRRRYKRRRRTSAAAVWTEGCTSSSSRSFSSPSSGCSARCTRSTWAPSPGTTSSSTTTNRGPAVTR